MDVKEMDIKRLRKSSNPRPMVPVLVDLLNSSTAGNRGAETYLDEAVVSPNRVHRRGEDRWPPWSEYGPPVVCPGAGRARRY
jgi:hypothetical protein